MLWVLEKSIYKLFEYQNDNINLREYFITNTNDGKNGESIRILFKYAIFRSRVQNH